jgi:hypothetical protein
LIFGVIGLRREANSYEVDIHGNTSGKLMMGRTGSSNVNIKKYIEKLAKENCWKVSIWETNEQIRWTKRRWDF